MVIDRWRAASESPRVREFDAVDRSQPVNIPIVPARQPLTPALRTDALRESVLKKPLTR